MTFAFFLALGSIIATADDFAPTEAALKAAADYSKAQKGQTCVVMFDGKVVFERYVIPSIKLVVVRQGRLTQGFSDIEFLSLLLRGKSASK